MVKSKSDIAEAVADVVVPECLGDRDGRLLKHATVRQATEEQEIAALRDFLVAIDDEFFVPVLLSKMVRFGDTKVTPFELRRAPRQSLLFLEEVYRGLNGYSVERCDPSVPPPEGAGVARKEESDELHS